VKILRVETLISRGDFALSEDWRQCRSSLHEAIRRVEWPAGTGKFTIYPEEGKKRGKGNGVKPIKLGLINELAEKGWKPEESMKIVTRKKPGKLDEVLYTDHGPVALEWETGNISSSHRALNKMVVGLLNGLLICGVLVVPSRALYRFLTDRVGNMDELEPYFDMWRSVRCGAGILEVV